MLITKKFNEKLVRNILKTENEYISNLFNILPIPSSSIHRGFNEDELVKVSKKTSSKLKGKNLKTRVRSLEELQNRLLELKKNKKFNYKDKLLKKGLKNRIKKKEKRIKNKSFKKGVKIEESENLNGNDYVEDESKIKPNKPIFNSQGKMVFSKFDFSQAGYKSKTHKNKNLQKNLETLQKQEAKLKELKESGEQSKAEELKQKLIWKSALAKAEGEKIKDDPDLLKKTIKKRQQEVKTSKKKWKVRQEGVQKAKEEKQKIRQENINKRKKDKKLNKLKKAAKRGKIVPGL